LSTGQSINLATHWVHSTGGHCNPGASFIRLDTPWEHCKGASTSV